MTICRFKAGLIAGLFALAGCSETDGLPFAEIGNDLGLKRAATPPAWAKALSKAQLASGDVILQAPDDWCIEPRSLKNTTRESFALLAGCYELTSGGTGSASPEGYITVSVGARMLEDVSAEATLQAILEGAQTTSTSVSRGIALAQLPVSGEEAAPVWRAVTNVGRRVVLVTAHAPELSALSGPFGGTMVNRVAGSLVANFVVEDVAQN